jgi:uncharacterized membrane protein
MFLIAITLVAFLLRICDIGKLSFWQDELFTTSFIYSNLKDLPYLMWQKDVLNMSFYYLLANIWTRFFSNINEISLRSLSALFSIASIPLIFILGKEFSFDKEKATLTGLIASLLVAVNFFHIQYAQEFRGYSLMFMLAALSSYLFIKAIEKRTSISLWGSYLIVSAIAIYTHLFVILLIVAHGASLIYPMIKKSHAFPFKKIVVSFILMLTIIFPLLIVILYKKTAQFAWIPSFNFATLNNFLVNITGLKQPGWFLNLYIFVIGIYLIVIMCRMGKLKGLIQRWKFLLLMSCLFLPVILTIFFSAIKPIFVDRYLIFVMPYLAIVTANGIVSFVDIERWRNRNFIEILLFGTLMVVLLLGTKNYFDTRQKEDYRSMAGFMTDNCTNGLILFYPQYVEPYIPFYNPSLKSQMVGWQKLLNQSLEPKDLIRHFPSGYEKLCLMLGIRLDTVEERKQIDLARKAFILRYPKLSINVFPEQLEVDVFSRQYYSVFIK